MVFFRQLKTILWKNFLVKSRHPAELLLEFAIPLLVMIGLWGIRLSLNSRVTDVYIPSNSVYSESFQDFYSNPWCESENLVWLCASSNSNCGEQMDEFGSFPGCKLKRIAVAPSDSSDIDSVNAVRSFIQWTNDTIPATNNNTLFVEFETQKEFLKTIDQKSYSRLADEYIYSALVVFRSGHPNWDYTVRMNRTRASGPDDLLSSPQTRVSPVDNSVDTANKWPEDDSTWGTPPYLEAYHNIGMFALLETVNSFIATETCRVTGKCTDEENVSIRVEGIVDFPNKKIEEDIFWNALGSSFAILMILSVLYPISNVIKTLIQEKETKLREGMMMMSLRSDVIWTGWCIFYLAIFIPLSLFLTLVGQKLFLYSDMGLIFLYFMSFFLAALAFCVFVSIIFSKAKTGSIFGCFVFFAGYFIFDALLDTGKSRSQLLLACLHPSTAFSFGTSAFKEYEDNKIGVTAETWDVSDDNPITFQDVVMMQFVDVAWILALSWYLSQVWPSEYGLHKPWYFLFLPSYWISTCTPWCSTSQHQILVSHAEDSGIELSQRSAGSAVDDVPIETVPKNLLDQVGEKKCVHIHNLRKSFHTNTGTKVAVDGLDMTFYSGQITALLGHNGAGKSTAINMLTGLYPPDEGSAVIQGFDISQDMYEVRKILGVCPQHDVLQPYMTVEEHLEFFASVKGCSPEEIQQEVTRLIDAVGLKEKRKEYSKNLSGGQKRKLSVAIAFIGKSKVVILDEPTSGMDPFSRRATWNVIRQHREGRVIILVTHFMDEADLLGDRIAIMGDGKLRCCGSPLFLKRAFGVGYNITIEKNAVANFDVTGTIGTISQFVADAKLLTNVGTELSVQLPFTGSAGFQPLFEYFDDNMESMGIKSYGMSVTTLEEVFLKVASGTNTISTALGGMEPREERIQKAAEPRENGHKYHTVIAADEVTEGALVVGSEMREESPPQSAQPLGSEEVYEQVESTDPESQQKKPYELDEAAKVGEFKPIEMFFQHMKALLLKRYLYFIRDSRSWGFQFALPIIFVLGGALLMHFNEWAPDQPMIVISASNYNKGMSSDFLPLPFTAATDVCPIRSDCSKSMYAISGQEYIMNSIMDASKFPMEPQYDGLSVYNISDFVLKQRDQYKASRFGAITFTDILYNDSSVNSGGIQEVRYLVHGNYTGVHAGPIYTNLVAEGVLRSIDSATSLTVRLHPLPETKREEETLTSFNLTNLISLTIIAMAFIPAAFAYFVVYEKESKCYHQQIVSGVSLPAYWLSTFIWDNITYQISVWLILVIIILFPNTSLLTGDEAFGTFIALFMLFGPAICGFTYLLTFFFRTAAGAQIITIFVMFILGLGLSITALVLRFIPSTHDLLVDTLRYVFVLFPPCALGEGMNNLALRTYYSDLELGGNRQYDAMDWNICGLNILVMGIEGVAFILLTILVDYTSTTSRLRKFLDSGADLPECDGKDDDVTAEEASVAEGRYPAASVPVLVKDIKKRYPSGNYAVKGVSLAIPHGECFGLLGVNGAGKSSLLNMLSGEFGPTSGDAFLAGHSVVTDMAKCRYHIGFCPQFDAIYDLLSAREHLNFYAAVKGIRPQHIPEEVKHKISDLGLTEYADRAAGGYSGGNKRKLSVAMAMVAEPAIMFLDEPSTGMDPMARRFMWEVIGDLVTRREKCSLILTTHSMEECEALCTRIGIMVGGVLKCLGSSQHLKSRYGLGYQMEVLFEIPDNESLIPVASALRTAAGLSDTVESLTEDQLITAFNGCGYESWIERLTPTGTGIDVRMSLESNGEVTVNHLASWCILETRFDALLLFLDEHFAGYKIRERQMAKVRMEVPSEVPGTNTHRRLSAMFGLVESHIAQLFIREYSVAQTSLEQIFNSFAAEQQEDSHNATSAALN